MTKTCGTCGHGTRTAIACHALGLYPATWQACESWTERTDSLEQVALDMLDELRDAEAHIWVGRITDAYADRLRALGVEVSQ